MQWVLKEWQGVFVNGNHVKSDGIRMDTKHGKTLSSCYQKFAQKMDSSLRRKRKLFGEYHEQVFANMAASSGYGSDSQTTGDATTVCVGSRPMESASDYLRFLDLFYAVSFNEAVGSEREKCERPLLVRYSDEVRNNELNSLSNQVIGKLRRRETERSNARVVSPHRPPLSPRRTGSLPERNTRGKLTEKQHLLKQHAIGGARCLEPPTQHGGADGTSEDIIGVLAFRRSSGDDAVSQICHRDRRTSLETASSTRLQSLNHQATLSRSSCYNRGCSIR